MIIKIKPLNKDEVYCCGVNKIKKLFKDSSVQICFTSQGRSFQKNFQHPMYQYAKKKVNGTVVAYMCMSAGEEAPLLVLHSFKTNIFSSELISKFEEEFLICFFRFYSEQSITSSLARNWRLLLVELHNGNLILHNTNL